MRARKKVAAQILESLSHKFNLYTEEEWGGAIPHGWSALGYSKRIGPAARSGFLYQEVGTPFDDAPALTILLHGRGGAPEDGLCFGELPGGPDFSNSASKAEVG
jgi:hypothetical protein